MKILIPLLFTLVLTACGGGGGGASGSSAITGLYSVLTLNQTNRVYNTAVGDLNNDGLEDVVVSGWKYNVDGAYVWIFIQNSDGTLSDRTNQLLTSNVIHGSQHAYIADFDNDGRNDIFLPGFLDGTQIVATTSYMLWNTGNGFTRYEFQESVTAHGSCLDDFNSDGLMDMLVSGGGIYYNNGNRSFTLDSTPLQGRLYFDSCAVAHQANGNINILLGNNDAVAGYRNNLNIYDSTMNFQQSIAAPGELTVDLVEINAIDINADGIKDFVLSFNHNDTQPIVVSPYKTTYLSNAGTYTLGPTFDYTNNEYHSYTITLNGVPSLFLPSYRTGSKLYQVANNGLTEIQAGQFGRMSASASWATASAVYQNSSTGKVFMLHLLDGTFYTKEML